MDLGLLNVVYWSWSCGIIHARVPTTAVPGAPYLCTWNNLREPASLDMSDFDETRIEEKDIWRMEGNSFGSAFPLNGSR